MTTQPTRDKVPTVVVADDDPDVIAMVSHAIRQLGATIFEADDGEQALELIQAKSPDLVILDVMMPGMSGWEVCRSIRENVDTRNTKVLMLTGIGERLNDMTSPLYGADDYLDKPFDLENLKAHVSKLLAE